VQDAFGWPCPTALQMGEIDRHAIEKCGIPSRVLMETAGRAVADAIRSRYPFTRAPLILCGSGNNGGDGFVVARVLTELLPGCTARVATWGDVSSASPETRANYELLAQVGVECIATPDTDRLRGLVEASDVVVDALFGVGLSRPLEGRLAQVVKTVGSIECPRVAVDVPSGICATSGRALGVALDADLIVTLGLPKLGLAIRPPDGSRVLLADIGLPRSSCESVGPRATLLTARAVSKLLPARDPGAHKGRFGHCLVVGGARGKTGAPLLSARAALRGGTGLLTLAVPETVQAWVAPALPEAMTLGLPDLGAGSLAAGAGDLVVQALAERDALVIGPGLGLEPDTRRAVELALDQSSVPAVVDADALNVFAGKPEALRSEAPRILTPHPGEAARLLGSSVPEVQADRVAAALELARRSGAVVVLKGPRSLIARSDGRLLINPTGGPGLAAGGSGDVLAGLTGAMLAQGLDVLEAAAVAVFLHGRAGEVRAMGLLAREVADAVPDVWQALATAQECAHAEGPLVPLF